MSDRSAQSIASAKNAIAVGNAKQDIKSVSGAMARVGARVDSQNNKKIFVYCYNPKVPYSSNFGDAYYVNTGYANCNGLAYPVYINGNYAQFDLSGVSIRGTWAVMIQKIPNSEVWGVNVLFPSPTTVDSSDVMVWKDKDGNTVNLDADSWVIGSFILDIGTGTSNSITGLFMQSEAMTPTSFLKNRFMQVLNEAEGSDTDDFTSWANAMGCDGVFKRLAALEIFVNNLKANYLEVGGGTDENGFLFQAKRAVVDSGGVITDNSVFDVYYNGQKVFTVNPQTGDVKFGNNFTYEAGTGTVYLDRAVIRGDSFFGGKLDCALIKVEEDAQTSIPISDSASGNIKAKVIYDNADSAGLDDNTLYRASSSLIATVHYCKFIYRTALNRYPLYEIQLFDEDYNTINVAQATTCSSHTGLFAVNNSIYLLYDGYGNVDGYRYPSSSLGLVVYTTRDLLAVNIPDNNGGLSSGCLYHTSDGTVKVQLT